MNVIINEKMKIKIDIKGIERIGVKSVIFIMLKSNSKFITKI